MPTDPKRCIFCRIIHGEVPSTLVYQDYRALAFNDIKPAAPTHVLVVPRQHIEALAGTSPEQEALLGHLVRVASQVAQQAGIERSGFRVLINQGKDAGQMIDHLHLHVLGGRPLGKMA